MVTLNLTSNVQDHILKIKLPDDIPMGLVDVVLVLSPRKNNKKNKKCTLGDLAKSPYIGMWKDRADIKNTSDFAANLRERAWRRSKWAFV